MSIRKATIAGAVTTAMIFALAQPSYAAQAPSTPPNAVPISADAAVSAEQAKAMAETGPVSLFDRANEEVTLVDPNVGVMSLGLPGQTTSNAPSPELQAAAASEGAGEVLGVTTLDNASIATFDTDRGSQSLISIQNPQAPQDYEFILNLPQGATAALQSDGSVAITDAAGAVVGGVDTPWARDAHGVAVPTHFTLTGNKLIQTVEHTSSTAFPVVADPSTAWGWTKCVGEVAVFAASNSIVAAKIAKLVQRFGSIRRAVEIAYRAYKAAPKGKQREAVQNAVGAIGAELLGITAVKEACFDS